MANITTPQLLQLVIFLLLFVFLITVVFFVIKKHSSKRFKKATAKDFKSISGENSAASRLDLARALIEMQQFDQARALLNQVLKMPDQDAKQEAEHLLQLLAGK